MQILSIATVVTLATITKADSEWVSYDGFSVLEVKPKSESDLEWLENSQCRSLNDLIGLGQPYQMLCDRKKARKLRHEARKKDLEVHFVSKHLGSEIKKEAKTVDIFDSIEEHKERRSNLNDQGRRVKIKKRVKKGTNKKNQNKNRFRHGSYLGSELLYKYLDQLNSQFNSMEIDVIGRSGEGRLIKIVKINANDTKLPTIFIDAGIHAREWISPAATLYLIEKLAKQINKGRGKNDIARYQWHIIPLVNPDGYEYTRTKDRLWRKNTVSNPGSSCIGVDLNRNFPEGYGVGASKNPCSEVYQGSHPFSELESITLRNYISKLNNIKSAVSIHSYGSVLIYPWGYKQEQHPSRGKLSSLAQEMSKAVKDNHQEYYEPGTAREVFGLWGLAGGATDDWYITQNIDYSYTFELPEHDKDGDHGFLLPASNIVKVGKQLQTAFVTMARNLSR